MDYLGDKLPEFLTAIFFFKLYHEGFKKKTPILFRYHARHLTIPTQGPTIQFAYSSFFLFFIYLFLVASRIAP